MAALIVQRPSPESETRPENFASAENDATDPIAAADPGRRYNLLAILCRGSRQILCSRWECSNWRL
jgi:hypothetical protein